MACNNCADPIYDNCVFYTGLDVPALCIKNGDSLADVEKSIFDSLLLLSTGEGTILPDIIIDNTTLLDLLKGKELNVANILQAIISYSESLDVRIEDLEETVNKPITVNAPCLTLPSSPTKDDILKATAEKVCTIQTSVTNIVTDYVKATDLCDAVAACLEELNSNPSNPTVVVQEYTKMPKYCPVAYLGPLSVFDSTGKGIESQGYDKVYLCNGNNGTDDLRGVSLIGANLNISGGALNAAVDPALPQNAGYGIPVKGRKGSFTDSLTASQGPPHNHTVTDPGHEHLTAGVGGETPLTSNTPIRKERAVGGNPSYDLIGTSSPASLGKSSKNTTGITIASSGQGTPHNTLHPVFGVPYIIYIP